MIKKIIEIFLLAAVLQTAAPEPENNFSDQIENFGQLVVEQNRERAALARQIVEIEKRVYGILILENTSISVTGGYSYNDPEKAIHDFSGSASATIPILDQLSITGTLDSEGAGSLSLLCTPLAGIPGDTSNTEELALLRLQYDSMKKQLLWQSKIALLHHFAAKKELTRAQAILNLKTREYENKVLQFNEGLCTLSELQAMTDDHASASIGAITALEEKLVKEQELLQLLSKKKLYSQIPEGSISIKLLKTMITKVKRHWEEAASSAAFTTYQEQTLLVNKYYREKNLKNSWPITPQISLSGSFTLPDGFSKPFSSMTANAQLSVGLSFSDFEGMEKKELKQQLLDIKEDLALVQKSLKIEQQALTGALDIAILSADMAERNWLIMKTAANMAKFDIEKKSINLFQYEAIQLDKNAAENVYISALINVYYRYSLLLQSYIF